MAYNERGWSAYSDPNTTGQTIQTEPKFMNPPTRGSSSSTTQIQVLWSAITAPQNGDLNVISYNLEWDSGTDGTVWSSLVGSIANSLATSFIATNNLIVGQTYKFRLSAKNIWGWGPYSTESSIQAAKVPAKMNVPAFSVDGFAGDFKLVWTEPDIQGDPITSYLIEIADSTTTNWIPYTPTCAGTNPHIYFCLIPMSVL